MSFTHVRSRAPRWGALLTAAITASALLMPITAAHSATNSTRSQSLADGRTEHPLDEIVGTATEPDFTHQFPARLGEDAELINHDVEVGGERVRWIDGVGWDTAGENPDGTDPHAQTHAAGEINEEWFFGGRHLLSGQLPSTTDVSGNYGAWDTVNIPHTWNGLDAQDGLANSYVRDWYWYVKDLGPTLSSWDGKRVYLELTGANTRSDIFLNGQRLKVYTTEQISPNAAWNDASPDPGAQGLTAGARDGGANAGDLVADQTNGQYYHRGGYTAFRVDLTDALRPDQNVLQIRVDNTVYQDTAPTTSDFPYYGGIYRQMYLVATDPVHVDLSDYGSSGLYVATPNAGKVDSLAQATAIPNDLGELDVSAHIVNQSGSDTSVHTHVVVKDEAGETVLTSAPQTLTIPAGSKMPFAETLTLDDPTLWQGISYQKDADNSRAGYQYTVELHVSRDGEVIDAVKEKVGFRWYFADRQQGFFLNGEPYQLNGVNRHQERRSPTSEDDRAYESFIRKFGREVADLDHGIGNALTNQMHDQDFQYMIQMGVTSIRLSHYPQSDYFYDLADANGIVVWAEIPLVNGLGGDPKFDEVTEVQLIELIKQQFNRPGIAFWGLQNEVGNANRGNSFMNVKQLMNRLHYRAKAIDPDRYTTQAVNNDGAMDENTYNQDGNWGDNRGWKSDLITWNIYPGWYGNFRNTYAEDMPGRMNDSRPMGLAEYGTGANIGQHEQYPAKDKDGLTAGGDWHPEEYSNIMHEDALDYFRNNEAGQRLWATYLWNMYDFAVPSRYEGNQPGLNDKGLITSDRRFRKDAFFLYKANWDHQNPFVYISSRRQNAENARQKPMAGNQGEFTDNREESVTYVKIYSNVDEVQIEVTDPAGTTRAYDTHEDEREIGTFWLIDPDSGDKLLMPTVGEYTVRALGVVDGDLENVYTDEIVWEKVPGTSTTLVSLDESSYAVRGTEITVLRSTTSAEFTATIVGTSGATYTLHADETAAQAGVELGESALARPGNILRVTSQDGASTASYVLVAASLSTGAAVTASSSTEATSPGKAVDGVDSTLWNATEGAGAWIQLDLGASSYLSSVDIDWNSTGGRVHYYRVLVSQDGVTFTPAVIRDAATQNRSGATGDALRVDGRYVRIEVTGLQGGITTAIRELRVNGWQLTSGVYAVDNDQRMIVIPRESVGENEGVLSEEFIGHLTLSGNARLSHNAGIPVIRDGDNLIVTDSDGHEMPYTITFADEVADKTVDHAVLRPAYASSVEILGGGNVKLENYEWKANDGDDTTRWVADTEGGARTSYPQWFAVDLGEVRTLTDVNGTFYSNGDGRTYSYEIYGSVDEPPVSGTATIPSGYTRLASGVSNAADGAAAVALDAEARYVLVQVTGSSVHPVKPFAAASFFDLQVLGTLDAVVSTTPSITATTRCVAGKVVVVARATNESAASADLTVTSPFGSKLFSAVPPEGIVSQAFSSRLRSVPAGEGAVTDAGGARAAAPYAAAACGGGAAQ